LKLELVVSKKVKYFLQCQVEVDGKNAFARAPHAQTDGQPGNIVSPVPFIAWAIGLPPVPDFPGCPGFVPCCPVSRQDKPRDAKCPGFQGKVKMTKIIIITIVIINLAGARTRGGGGLGGLSPPNH